MIEIGNTKLYTFDEILDEDLGEVGTPRRDKFEAEVEAEIQKYIQNTSSADIFTRDDGGEM